MLVVPSAVVYRPFTYIWTLAVGRFPDELRRRVARPAAVRESRGRSSPERGRRCQASSRASPACRARKRASATARWSPRGSQLPQRKACIGSPTEIERGDGAATQGLVEIRSGAGSSEHDRCHRGCQQGFERPGRAPGSIQERDANRERDHRHQAAGETTRGWRCPQRREASRTHYVVVDRVEETLVSGRARSIPAPPTAPGRATVFEAAGQPRSRRPRLVVEASALNTGGRVDREYPNERTNCTFELRMATSLTSAGRPCRSAPARPPTANRC